jgi:hypothetical protein
VNALERRLARLESERDLARLAAEYCHGADDRQIETFLAVWEPDAVWDVGPHRFTGVAEIEAAVRRQWDAFDGMLHTTSNPVIEFDTESLARGRLDVVSVAVLADGRRVLTTGRYDDVYARGADGWRIRERRAVVTTSTELPAPPG